MISFTERAIFTLVLLAFVAFLFYITLGLGPVARLVPLRVAIVTLALVVFQLLLDVLPRLAQRIHIKEQTNPFMTEQIKGAAKSSVRSNSHQSPAGYPRLKRELEIFLWILMIPTAIYLFGFLTAVPLYTFLFLKVRSREGYPISISAAVGLLCLVYGIFNIILSIRLEVGVFWRCLG